MKLTWNQPLQVLSTLFAAVASSEQPSDGGKSAPAIATLATALRSICAAACSPDLKAQALDVAAAKQLIMLQKAATTVSPLLAGTTACIQAVLLLFLNHLAAQSLLSGPGHASTSSAVDVLQQASPPLLALDDQVHERHQSMIARNPLHAGLYRISARIQVCCSQSWARMSLSL